MAIPWSVLPFPARHVTLPLATISALANRLTRHEIQSIRLKSGLKKSGAPLHLHDPHEKCVAGCMPSTKCASNEISSSEQGDLDLDCVNHTADVRHFFRSLFVAIRLFFGWALYRESRPSFPLFSGRKRDFFRGKDSRSAKESASPSLACVVVVVSMTLGSNRSHGRCSCSSLCSVI